MARKRIELRRNQKGLFSRSIGWKQIGGKNRYPHFLPGTRRVFCETGESPTGEALGAGSGGLERVL